LSQPAPTAADAQVRVLLTESDGTDRVELAGRAEVA
jgi:hypothetical protein